MGLRFRKTISILPGVRLNLGKSSASVSVGVPGFRKTFNTKGTVTTSVGLPGTGLYYVDSKNPGKEKKKAREKAEREAKKAQNRPAAPMQEAPMQQSPARQSTSGRRQPFVPQIQRRSIVGGFSAAQVDRESLLSIHKTADDSIDWAEIARLPEAPDPSFNAEMWRYYHSIAGDILSGDIDAYLRLIYEINPLDDLLDYGGEFTFGTDDPKCMHVEFTVNTGALQGAKSSMLREEYNSLLQDYICSTAIRIARDMFALLPVEKTIVHAQLQDETVLSAAFERSTMEKIRFGFIDPSNIMSRFQHNMNPNESGGLGPVERIE